VVVAGETIEVRAWAPSKGWSFDWSVTAGRLDANGQIALWDFSGVQAGNHSVTVKGVGPGAQVVSCTAQVALQSKTEARGGYLTRRFLLFGDGPKDEEYGLYSYLLLTPDGGDPYAKERNEACLKAYWHKLLPVVALERSHSRSLLNATFIPVKSRAPDAIDVQWLVDNYDYQRADRLMQKLSGDRSGGPYIIASKRPLHESNQSPILRMDLSWVPAKVIRFWVDEFLNQAAQERFEDSRSLSRFELKMRTVVSVLAEGVPKVEEALGTIIRILKVNE
jgi:hypothetical protein